MQPKKKTLMRGFVLAGLALTAAMTLVATDTWAQLRRPGAGGSPFGRMQRGGGRGPTGMLPDLRQLDLTDAQREQIRTVAQQHRETTREEVGEQLMSAREALRDAVTAEVANEGAIRTLASQLGTMEGDVAVARAQLNAQLWQLLTPDQQAQLRELQAQAAERRQQRRERFEQRRQEREQAGRLGH